MIRLMVKNIVFSLSIFMQTACEANMVTKKEDVVLFSKVRGEVFFGGKPAGGAEITRFHTYDTDVAVEDKCISDNDGKFEFPAILRKNIAVSGFSQFVVHQKMIVKYNGSAYKIWLHAKLDGLENEEYGGVFKAIRCELTDDMKRIEYQGNVIMTNCHFLESK